MKNFDYKLLDREYLLAMYSEDAVLSKSYVIPKIIASELAEGPGVLYKALHLDFDVICIGSDDDDNPGLYWHIERLVK